MTTNALSMVDQVLAGFRYKHYFARELYYAGTQNGPHVQVYLSDTEPVLTGTNSVMVGPGVRVDCYTSMTTNAGAQRLAVVIQTTANISWGVQELVAGDCRQTSIGGVLYDLPSAIQAQNNKANMVSAAANVASLLLLVFVLVALYWQHFRRR